MLKINNQMDDTVKTLYKNAKGFNHSSHIHLNEIFNDVGATAVISVYVDERPSDKVLSELSAWAEQQSLHSVIEKIEELTKLNT